MWQEAHHRAALFRSGNIANHLVRPAILMAAAQAFDDGDKRMISWHRKLVAQS